MSRRAPTPIPKPKKKVKKKKKKVTTKKKKKKGGFPDSDQPVEVDPGTEPF